MPVAGGGSLMAESADFSHLKPKPVPHPFQAGEPAFGVVIPWGAAIDYWTSLGLGRIEAYEKELTEYARRRLGAIDDAAKRPGDHDVGRGDLGLGSRRR